MKTLAIVAMESFTLLRRDRVFMPTAAAGIAVMVMAHLVSDFTIDNVERLLFGTGLIGYQLSGTFIALFWGSKVITDSAQEGSLEVQLVGPISRTTWLLGRFIGLVGIFLILAVVFIAAWQVFMMLSGFSWMSPAEYTAFGLITMSWLVLAALMYFLASFSGQAVALVVGICLWVAGMTSQGIALTVTEENAGAASAVIDLVARVWDFQQFIYLTTLEQPELHSMEGALFRFGYGGLLVVAFIAFACLIFERRDTIN